MEQPHAQPKGVRARVRETIRTELAEAAVRLVREVGLAGTTASAIAASVGVSERTFFRYFPTKEDAVLQATESLGSSVADALADRPATESDLTALRAAFEVAVDSVRAAPDRWSAAIALSRSEPNLRRRHLQQQDRWVELLTAANEQRVDADRTAPTGRLHSGVVMLAWEHALGVCHERGTFEQIDQELDAALGDVRRFVGG